MQKLIDNPLYFIRIELTRVVSERPLRAKADVSLIIFNGARLVSSLLNIIANQKTIEAIAIR